MTLTTRRYGQKSSLLFGGGCAGGRHRGGGSEGQAVGVARKTAVEKKCFSRNIFCCHGNHQVFGERGVD